MRALERLLIYEWETFHSEKGFNEKGGHDAQIRYQMRKSEWKFYGPPWMEMNVPLLPVGWSHRQIAHLDLMNDIGTIVSYLEKMPLDADICDILRGFVDRLQKRIDQLAPPV